LTHRSVGTHSWKSLADDPIFKKSEWDKVILSELPHARTRPAVEIYPDASLDFTQAFQEVLAGQKDPQQALKDAEERTLKTAREKGYLTG
jgi:ABC-type glycerol-3-phosphate transport system substrate-binding protein